MKTTQQQPEGGCGGGDMELGAYEKSRRIFMSELTTYMSEHGKPLGKIPIVGGARVNLYDMFMVVGLQNGYHNVTNNKMWREVGDQLSVLHSPLVSFSALISLSQHGVASVMTGPETVSHSVMSQVAAVSVTLSQSNKA